MGIRGANFMTPSRPLRFGMLTTFYPPWSFGGDGIQVQRLSAALAKRGHEVTVIHSREAYRTLSRDPPGPATTNSGVRVVSIDAGLGPASPLATHLTGRPLLVRGQLERALDERFDVLHFHNPSLLGGPEVLAMGEGVKLYTLHEQWLICPTHVLWKYRRRVCERPQCVRCSLTYRRPPQLWRRGGLLERSLEELDALIAPSDTTARLHERLAERVTIERLDHFLPDPLPEQRIPGSPDASPERPYFLFAGRLESIKGIEELVEFFRTPRGADLIVAGTGSLERSLLRRARDLPNVRLLGRLDQAPLAELYRDAVAVILPTRGHESFPLVMLEAFARGTPLVARRFSAQGELLESSGAGISYESDAELARGLDMLISDPELRRTLGARGRSAYERRWTPDVHMKGYFSLIGRLARQRGDADLAAAAEAAR
jgi:glycosyltransferase involved in cell wall biosynthesis